MLKPPKLNDLEIFRSSGLNIFDNFLDDLR
jgi:hypothetical protein